MASYTVNFTNSTTQTWTMGVYQTLPSAPGLDSVSWQQTSVPQSGFSGVKWDVNYDVAIADYQQTGGIGVYTASQTITEIELGTAWDIVFKDNVQQLEAAGSAPQNDMIVVNNNSNLKANPGIGMSGQGSVFKQGVLSGASAQFVVEPTYWVALFNQLVLGEVISSNVIVGPLKVQYPSGLTAAHLTASIDGQKIVLDLTYGTSLAMDLEDVKKVTAALAQSRKAA